MTAEKRYFRLDQNAIPLLIQSQAGSLQKAILKDPSTQSWDHDTEDAWIKLDDSHSLKVYSQGFFQSSVSSTTPCSIGLPFSSSTTNTILST